MADNLDNHRQIKIITQYALRHEFITGNKATVDELMAIFEATREDIEYVVKSLSDLNLVNSLKETFDSAKGETL